MNNNTAYFPNESRETCYEVQRSDSTLKMLNVLHLVQIRTGIVPVAYYRDQ